MIRCSALGLLLSFGLGLEGCLPLFPEYSFDDLDGDLFSEADGDCNDGDAATHPEANECSVRGDVPVDNDCDGMVDGPALPWVDNFDDEHLSSLWYQPHPGLVVLEHSGGEEPYHLDGSEYGFDDTGVDGVVEQVVDSNFGLILADGAECWQDISLTARLLPDPDVKEFICQFHLRTRDFPGDADTPNNGYEFFLYRHSSTVDGNFEGNHYDGSWQSHLERHVDGQDTCLVNDCDPDTRQSSATDLDTPGTAYTIHVAASESQAGVELLCEYDADDGQGFRPCFDEAVTIDDGANHPLTGGIAIVCSDRNYNWWFVEPEGIRIDYVLIEEAV